jgi:ERF superfamily protein
VTDKSKTVFEALGAVMAEVQAVGKNNRNNEQGYNFRGIDAVINAVGPVFRKHGVVAVPLKTTASYRDVLTVREKRSRECTVAVTYRFYGPAGDYIDAEVPGESMDFGDKGAAKAMSVAYRIALLQVLCIPTDEPDADSVAYERADIPQHPSWDPETQLLIDAFKDEVRTAKTAAELRDVGKRVHAALKKGEITQVAYDFLARSAADRLAKLEVPA